MVTAWRGDPVRVWAGNRGASDAVFVVLIIPVILYVRVLGWRFSLAGHDTRVLHTRRDPLADSPQLHAEVPLVPVVEQEQELLLASGARERDVTDLDAPGCARVRSAAGALK